jgi:hypothetical protein
MSVKKFKFVSPGIFVNEIDNSQLPASPEDLGPVIIGRARKGPSMVPVRVTSFSEFVDVFGQTTAGGISTDFYREENLTSPMYGAYAAQAYLRNSSPVTFVRLMGTQHDNLTEGSGEAGWKTAADPGTTFEAGGAYGLFVINSSSVGNPSDVTGALAAVWYFDKGHILLSGSGRAQYSSDSSAIAGAGSLSGTMTMISTVGDDYEFKAIVNDGTSGTSNNVIVFNFNEDSDKYIRKVFNTNPTLSNESVTAAGNRKYHWLGESFDKHLKSKVTGSTSSTRWGVIMPLQAQSNVAGHKFQRGFTRARTGWTFAQDLGVASDYTSEAMQKLFRLRTRGAGKWIQENLKVSIEDIKASTSKSTPFGSFTITIRKLDDHDGSIKVVERFTRCNLNRNSVNFIARKIGDKRLTWSDTERRHTEYGEYDNQSSYVYVEVDDAVAEGTLSSKELLPFGFYGPPKYKTISYGSGSAVVSTIEGEAGQALASGSAFQSSGSVGMPSSSIAINVGTQALTCAWEMPALTLRSSSIDGDLPAPENAYFGVDTTEHRPGTGSIKHDDSIIDVLRMKSSDISDDGNFTSGTYLDNSFLFTLDDLRQHGIQAHYVSGSRRSEGSITAVSGGYQKVLDKGFDRFTMVFHGGSDGLDLHEQNPWRNSGMGAEASELDSYAYNSIKRAIDTVKDPEDVEYNVACVPGITNTKLTDKLISNCEQRADALAIIDLENGFTPADESTDAITSRLGSVDSTLTSLKNRGINSSYGCAYYPWVQVRDTFSNQLVWVPPSVVALGTFSSSQARSELWFAPAGFTRGGLTEGSAGIPVTGVRERLTVKKRDKLYEANVNPIAKFPAEGIVVFGQKTLQTTRSALDRINVRRLMIFVKKEISRIAATTLFEQNVRETWNGFIGRAEPFLRSVKARLGLVDFKIILDETTTTPDLIDRNIMYAKIYLKPARAIEFIAIDFVITDSGASFED